MSGGTVSNNIRDVLRIINSLDFEKMFCIKLVEEQNILENQHTPNHALSSRIVFKLKGLDD